MPHLARLVRWALILVHASLVVWAVVGLLEMVLPEPPWPPISNERFPPWMLLAQWLTTLVTASLFVWGGLTGWARLPIAIAVGYATMATVCGVQNFSGMLVHDTHFHEMAAEYVVYAAILFSLFHWGALRAELRLIEVSP